MIGFSLDEIFGTPVALARDEIENPVRKRKSKTETVLKPIRPSAGVEAVYRQKLLKIIDEMGASVQYWIEATYKGNPPEVRELAQDGLSSNMLRDMIRRLVSRWTRNFDTAAEKLATYFATAVHKRSDATLKKILKDGGFSIEFRMTAAQRSVLNATVADNVALIKSIPAQYLTQVEGIVMRSVTAGRDVGQLARDLREQLGVTKRRAAFIARDQNNKATAMLQRARQIECGIDEAEWRHSGGGAHPRPTHVAAGRERTRFSVVEGWPDPALGGKRIWPGTEPNCKCFARPVLRGLAK